jgi:hypothetical protein
LQNIWDLVAFEDELRAGGPLERVTPDLMLRA